MMFQTDNFLLETASTGNLEEIIHTSRPKYVDVQLLMYDIFIPILAILIIVLNSLIVVSSGLILHRGQQPRSTYIFLGNVALSDLLMGIVVIFGQYYPSSHRNEMVCCVMMGFTVSSTMSSIYSVGLIAIDRYLYILYGLQYQSYIYPNRARLMILATWVLGLIVGFLPTMGLRNSTDNGLLCWFVILAPPEVVFITATAGVIPLIVVLVLYSIILRHALNKIGELKSAAKNEKGIQSGSLRLFRGRGSNVSVLDESSENVDDNEKNLPRNPNKLSRIFRRKKNSVPQIAPVYNPSKWKAIKIVLYTTGSFFITWFPFYIASTLFALCNPEKTPRYCDNLKVAIASPLYILGLTNSILNPLIYAWWHNGFRESVKKLYRNVFSNRSIQMKGSTTGSTRTRTSAISRNSNGNDNGKLQSDRRSGGGVGMTSGSEVDNSDLEQGVIMRPKKKLLNKKKSDEEIGINNNEFSTNL